MSALNPGPNPAVVGLSIAAVDPGTHTGLAWLCISQKEVSQKGLLHGIERAIGDNRFRTKEIAEYGRPGELFSREIGLAYDCFGWIRERHSETLRITGNRFGLTHIVIEDFILRRQEMTRALLSPVRVTAQLTLLLDAVGMFKLVGLQQPANAKSVVTDERLRLYGLWTKGSDHCRDATRHAMLCAMRNYGEK